MDGDSSLSIGTHYRLEGSGLDPVGGEIFHTRPDRPWGPPRGVFRPRQTRQLTRAVDLKGRLLSCQSY